MIVNNSNVEEYDELMDEIAPAPEAREYLETNHKLYDKTGIEEETEKGMNRMPTVYDMIKMASSQEKLSRQLTKSKSI